MMLDLKYPYIVEYRRAAAMHYDAARFLLDQFQGRGSSPHACEVVYLSGYIAECILKALLLTRTPPRLHPCLLEELKDPKVYGHDIEAVRETLQVNGLVISSQHLAQIRTVRGKWSTHLRYTARRILWPDASKVLESAESIYHWINGGRP
jgi:hypothetical protein